MQIHSPVDRSSAFAASEYHERCWPDETSSLLRAVSQAPSCSDGPAYARPPYSWQNSPSIGPGRDLAATRSSPRCDRAARYKDIERDSGADVPQWPDAAFFGEADELRLNRPPVQRH